MSRRRPFVVIAALLLVAGACGGGDDEDAGDLGATDTTRGGAQGEVVAQVASYELVAGRDQRFLAALAGSGDGRVVSFGSVDLDFYFLGTREAPLDPPQPRGTTRASFMPVAGESADPSTPGPRLAKPSEGLGVYVATPVRFDDAGLWGVDVRASIGDKQVSAEAAFEVFAESRLPFPGQPAPRTEHPVAGSPGVDPVAIDSRAADGQPIPDAALHSTTIAAALAGGRPLLVVVSTPVYCVSRFCGPITDSVARLAERYSDRMAFVHLEVWQDFENKVLNPAAAEWIAPKGGRGDTQEPWIFLVGSDGIVRQRLDNVISDADLESAVTGLLAAS